jgi:hypothetical protein
MKTQKEDSEVSSKRKAIASAIKGDIDSEMGPDFLAKKQATPPVAKSEHPYPAMTEEQWKELQNKTSQSTYIEQPTPTEEKVSPIVTEVKKPEVIAEKPNPRESIISMI